MSMGFNGHKVYTASVATAGTSTSAFNVGGFNHVAFELPTVACDLATATCNVYCQVSNSETGTFRRVQDMGVYSANSGIYDWEVPSTTGNRTVVVRPASRFNWVKIEISTVATNGYLSKVHVHM